jgi:hypothetical protein
MRAYSVVDRIMKTAASKHTSPVIVPLHGKDMQKDYALTPAEAKKVMTKLSSLHAKRKAEGKVTRVKGRFSPGFFD